LHGMDRPRAGPARGDAGGVGPRVERGWAGERASETLPPEIAQPTDRARPDPRLRGDGAHPAVHGAGRTPPPGDEAEDAARAARPLFLVGLLAEGEVVFALAPHAGGLECTDQH